MSLDDGMAMETQSVTRHLEAELDLAIRRASAPRLARILRKPLRLIVLAVAERLGPALSRTWSVECRTFFSVPLTVALPEHVSSQVFSYGYHEPELSAALLRSLGPGDVFVDVGAHLGYFSALASAIVGETGEVHSFEPTPSTFARLSKNAQRFPAPVHVVQAAVTAGGSASVEINDLGVYLSAHNSLREPRLPDRSAHRTRRVTVPALALDAYFGDTARLPAFVKIDAESAEMQVLQGMQGIIRRARPLISVEVGDYDLPGVARSRDIVAWLQERDYVAHEMAGMKLQSHVLRERYGYENLLFIPRSQG